jgi:uncharacterized protein (TIGR03083 family)
MTDEGTIYGACRERVSTLVRDLDDERAGRPVPATSDWSIHDVVAHLVGVVADLNAGRVEGAGSAEWTGAQVAARRGLSMADLVAEWEDGAPRFQAGLTAIGGPMAALTVADVWNHEQDIRGALGIEGGHDPAAEHLAIAGYCSARTGQIGEAALAPLRLRSGNDEWVVGDGAPGATVTAEPYELARFICLRRTPDQMRAYRWDGDPEPYVAMLSADAPSEPLPS